MRENFQKKLTASSCKYHQKVAFPKLNSTRNKQSQIDKHKETNKN